MLGRSDIIIDCMIIQGRWASSIVQVKTAGSVGWQELFTYYVDELTFTASEFIGMTVGEGRRLHFERDVTWLKSD